MCALSTRSGVQTSSSPQSLKKGIWGEVCGGEALVIGKKGMAKVSTYRFIDSVFPSLIQHRPGLGVVDLKS